MVDIVLKIYCPFEKPLLADSLSGFLQLSYFSSLHFQAFCLHVIQINIIYIFFTGLYY